MATKVYLSSRGPSGDVVDVEQATVSVFDRGFLYGDSVYETLRTAGGNPVEFERHLRRLHHSASGIGLVIPFPDDHIAATLQRTHAATGNADSRARIIVTRGQGPLMLDPRRSVEPLLVMIVEQLELPSAQTYQRGISALIVDVEKAGGGLVDPGIKTGNYLNNVLAVQQAVARGADDAILCNSAGEVAEGATSNVFAVLGDELVTPHLEAGLLAGITREVVCELATNAGFTVRERTLLPDQLRQASEVFLTSSVRGVMPVTRLDGASVGDGRVGPVTTRLLECYAQYIDRCARTDATSDR